MNRAILLLIFIGSPLSHAFAQNMPDLFRKEYSFSPVKTNGQRAQLQGVDIDLRLPVSIQPSNIMVMGVSYKSLWITNYADLSKTLKGVGMQVIFQHALTEKKAVNLFVAPGIFSDFEDVTSEDVRVSAGGRLQVNKSDNFKYSVGLAYSYQFFGNLFIPLMDVNWRINDHWRVTGPFPINTQLTYKIKERFQAAYYLEANNNSYRLSEDEESRYVQIKQWNTGLRFEYTVRKNWIARIKIGHTVNRQLDVYEKNAWVDFNLFTIDFVNNRTPIGTISADDWLISASIAFKLTEPKAKKAQEP